MTTAVWGPAGRTRTGGGRRTRTWLLAGSAAVIVGPAIGLAVASSGGTSSAPVSVAARPAPLFRLAPVGSAGGAVTLGRAAGRPVVLSFFASWCDGCRAEMATMAEVARLPGDVRVIGIDVNDTPGSARSLLRADHISYAVGADSAGAVAASYRLDGLPTTVFLDARHMIVGEAVGPLAVSSARRWVQRLAGS